jgi:hypothetical protein
VRSNARGSLSGPCGCVDRDHRLAAGVHGVDDFGVVDALDVDRRDAEVAVAQLALDDDQRDALARQLNGMRVTQLVGCEAPPNTRLTAVLRRSALAAALDQCRPRVGPLMTHNSGPTGSSSRRSTHGCSSSQPRRPCRPRGVGLLCRGGRAARRGADRDRPLRARALRGRAAPPATGRRSGLRVSPLPHWNSDRARDPSDRELARADVVPMHRMQRVRPSGASVGVG